MIPSADIESLSFTKLDGEALDDLLSGSQITGAEPIDYPLTDGVLLYLKTPDGRDAVLLIEQDPAGDSFNIAGAGFATASRAGGSP